MLNVARLNVLKEVAYRGSISAAAEALSYTQSAISQQIATLEAETGMVLLERHPRGVSLTAAGQTLVSHAEGILARLEGTGTASQRLLLPVTFDATPDEAPDHERRAPSPYFSTSSLTLRWIANSLPRTDLRIFATSPSRSAAMCSP